MPTAKVARKGQLTISVEFGEKLGGILHKYAIKDKPIEEVLHKEKEVIKEVFTEKHIND